MRDTSRRRFCYSSLAGAVSFKLPDNVREAILVTVAAELGEARRATCPLRQTGISTKIKIHAPSGALGPRSLAEANQRAQQAIERERRRSSTDDARDDKF